MTVRRRVRRNGEFIEIMLESKAVAHSIPTNIKY